MKTETLMELVKKWERDAQDPGYAEEDTPEGRTNAAQRDGRRRGLKQAAEDLRTLVGLLG